MYYSYTTYVARGIGSPQKTLYIDLEHSASQKSKTYKSVNKQKNGLMRWETNEKDTHFMKYLPRFEVL